MAQAAMASAPQAAPDRIDLWCFAYQAVLQDAAAVQACEALLADAEARRYHAFRAAPDRLQYLATRALVRTTLSRYAATGPADWTFVNGQHGKPALARQTPGAPLFFNVSNTPGLVVCAVSRTFERIGVDVERRALRTGCDAIAQRFFAAGEAAAICATGAAGPARDDAFVRYWTLKEAWLKATGAGLSVPLDQFSFAIGPGRPGTPAQIAVQFAPGLDEAAGHWLFAQWRLGDDCVVALAADTAGRPAQVHCIDASHLGRTLSGLPGLPGPTLRAAHLRPAVF